MATLVTGGTGFVGANIVRQLARAGHRVVSYDLAPEDPLVDHFVRDCADGITFVQGDILDEGAVARIGADFSIDKIVHAAVYTVNQTGLEIERSKAIADINFTGTVNLLELARTLRVGRFVYVSSGAAYGMAADNDQTFNEEMPAAPNTLYGITKYASELLTRRYGELHGISTASVRLSTPYGPMERGHRPPGRDVGALRVDPAGSARRRPDGPRPGRGPRLHLCRRHRQRSPGPFLTPRNCPTTYTT